jgi:NADH-quinone oxidoreductase subunit K
LGPLADSWIGTVNTYLGIALFAVGLLGLLTQRNTIKQIISVKIVLQGVVLELIEAGRLHSDPSFAQSMVISALIVESVVLAIGLALVVNVYRHYPSGNVDDMNRLRG